MSYNDLDRLSRVNESKGYLDRHIPLSLWQQARPVMEYTVQQWQRTTGWWQAYSSERLKAALNSKQPNITIISVKSQQQHLFFDEDEHHVVLSDLSWWDLSVEVSRAPFFRHRFVLSATPHLQHLSVAVNMYCTPLSASSHTSLDCGDRIMIPDHTILAQLPHLTALSCLSIQLTTQTLIDIAAHATLEHIHLDDMGLRGCAAFHTDGEEVQHIEAEKAARTSSGDRAEVVVWPAHSDPAYGLDRRERDIRRISLSLVRVSPHIAASGRVLL